MKNRSSLTARKSYNPETPQVIDDFRESVNLVPSRLYVWSTDRQERVHSRGPEM